MAWKKKEKPLSPEEAIQLAKKELAPIWFNTEPLLAAVRTESGASVLPLNSSFVQQPWVYAFIDPTEFHGEPFLQTIREWHRRYSPHKVGLIAVFRAPVPFVKSAPDYLRKFQVQFPAVYDQDGLFSSAFGIHEWPALVFQRGTSEIARGAGVDHLSQWLADSEQKLQSFLRESDPGLSLSLPCTIKPGIREHSRIDFGTQGGTAFASLKDRISALGNWKEAEDCLMTSDPEAKLVLKIPSSLFAIVAHSAIDTQLTKILIEPEAGSVLQEWAPENVSIDENGHGVARIQLFGLYCLLQGLPANRREVRLSFPDADTVPINIHGFRFGSDS